MDAGLMRSGTWDFSDMPGLYVLTITEYDPFGYDYMMYRIKNQCVEVPELHYDDEVEFIYFYAGGAKGRSPEIKAMLSYLQGSVESNVRDVTTQQVHDCVRYIKDLPEVRGEYMTVEDYMEARAKETKRETRVEDILDLLADRGEVPESVREKLFAEKSEERLRKWLNEAARWRSLIEFWN